MHPFVQLVTVIWVCAAFATWKTKDSECLLIAGIVTALAGFGYMLHHA